MHMKTQNSIAAAYSAALLTSVASLSAEAQTFIGASQITPSTSLPSTLGFTINQIADGITSDAAPYNGFASTAASGTITLDFAQTYTLGAFMLWNDVNVFQEGISRFRLDFYDSALVLQGSSAVFVGPVGQLAPATYSFASQANVRRVNLVVIDSNVSSLGINRIEIREIGFLTPVPEPSQLALMFFGVGALAIRFKSRYVLSGEA
jgi:hypothetical protein